MSRSVHGKRGRPLRVADGKSKLVRAEVQPDDRQIGAWPREALLRMDEKFCAAMQAAIERGLERPVGEAPERAA
jgi:hypothetical protein